MSDRPSLPGGSLDYEAELRATLRKAITQSRKTRQRIAAEMAALVDRHISEAMLDAWTAPTRSKWRFPFECAAAFEVATDSTCLIELLARKRGLHVINEEGRLHLELGRIKRLRAELEQEEAKVTRLLDEGQP